MARRARTSRPASIIWGGVSYYSPITDDGAGHYAAAPEYYGLLAFAQIGAGEQLGVTVARGAVNLTAYAVRRGDGRVTLAVINKDLTPGCDSDGDRCAARAGRGDAAARAIGFRFERRDVWAARAWTARGAGTARAPEPVKGVLNVPAASAALVTFTA